MKVCTCKIKLPPRDGVCLICGGEPPEEEVTAHLRLPSLRVKTWPFWHQRRCGDGR